MKIPQRLSWGGITSITERTTQAREGWGSRVVQQKTCIVRWGGNYPNSTQNFATDFQGQIRFRRRSVPGVLD